MSGFRRPIQMYRKQETAHSSPKPEQPAHTATMQTQSSPCQETCQPNTATPDADKSHHQESMNQTMEINTQSENSFHPEHGTVPSNATKPDTAETEKN